MCQFDLGEGQCNQSDQVGVIYSDSSKSYSYVVKLRVEVEFRFANNKVFLPGTQNGTVGDTYTKYMTGENAGFYQPSDARVKAAKGPTLFLELYINKVAVSTYLRTPCILD